MVKSNNSIVLKQDRTLLSIGNFLACKYLFRATIGFSCVKMLQTYVRWSQFWHKTKLTRSIRKIRNYHRRLLKKKANLFATINYILILTAWKIVYKWTNQTRNQRINFEKDSWRLISSIVERITKKIPLLSLFSEITII